MGYESRTCSCRRMISSKSSVAPLDSGFSPNPFFETEPVSKRRFEKECLQEQSPPVFRLHSSSQNNKNVRNCPRNCPPQTTLQKKQPNNTSKAHTARHVRVRADFPRRDPHWGASSRHRHPQRSCPVLRARRNVARVGGRICSASFCGLVDG